MASSADDGVLVLLDELREDLGKESKGKAKVELERHQQVLGGLKALRDILNGPKIQGTLNEVQRRLDTPADTTVQDRIVDVLHRLQQLRPPRVRAWWVWPASVVLAVGLGIGGTWGVMRAPTSSWATLGARIDGVLVEHYRGLSKPAQDALNGVYRQLGVKSPGDRKGPRS